ncbi:unnamed protein product, partial [Mesorhabditis spiculigera]
MLVVVLICALVSLATAGIPFPRDSITVTAADTAPCDDVTFNVTNLVVDCSYTPEEEKAAGTLLRLVDVRLTALGSIPVQNSLPIFESKQAAPPSLEIVPHHHGACLQRDDAVPLADHIGGGPLELKLDVTLSWKYPEPPPAEKPYKEWSWNIVGSGMLEGTAGEGKFVGQIEHCQATLTLERKCSGSAPRDLCPGPAPPDGNSFWLFVAISVGLLVFSICFTIICCCQGLQATEEEKDKGKPNRMDEDENSDDDAKKGKKKGKGGKDAKGGKGDKGDKKKSKPKTEEEEEKSKTTGSVEAGHTDLDETVGSVEAGKKK